MSYWICSKCKYGIKTKSPSVHMIQCPLCEKYFTLFRASKEEYDKCEMRDLYN